VSRSPSGHLTHLTNVSIYATRVLIIFWGHCIIDGEREEDGDFAGPSMLKAAKEERGMQQSQHPQG
jgi:hypothetical protein